MKYIGAIILFPVFLVIAAVSFIATTLEKGAEFLMDIYFKLTK